MIIVTGSAGFIGSCLVSELNYLGYHNLILVDDFSNQKKNKNLKNSKFHKKIDRNHFIDWFSNNYKEHLANIKLWKDKLRESNENK